MGKYEMESEQLLPCPFCGGKADLSKWQDGDDGLNDIWLIACEKCPAEMRADRQTCERLADLYPDQKDAVIAAWNARKTKV